MSEVVGYGSKGIVFQKEGCHVAYKNSPNFYIKYINCINTGSCLHDNLCSNSVACLYIVMLKVLFVAYFLSIHKFVCDNPRDKRQVVRVWMIWVLFHQIMMTIK